MASGRPVGDPDRARAPAEPHACGLDRAAATVRPRDTLFGARSGSDFAPRGVPRPLLGAFTHLLASNIIVIPDRNYGTAQNVWIFVELSSGQPRYAYVYH